MAKLLNRLKFRRNREGFTLVELMVVVAIIGILASVAIPNYQRYQARARQSEAKVSLSGAYTAQQSFFAEFGTYSACQNDIGFQLSTGSRRFYTVGFNTIGTTVCGPAGTGDCRAWRWTNAGAIAASCTTGDNTTHFARNAQLGVTTAITASTDNTSITNGTLNQTAFTVGARGFILTGTADEWQITEGKDLSQVTSGI